MSQNTSQANNKRIAKNTLMLYVRMIINMAVSLYTSRVVLEVLGVEDFGVYNVVGGVVGMLGFLNATMSGATSRFLTYELGKGDKERLSLTFNSALIVHIAIALIVLLVAETFGLWFVYNKIVIPDGRMTAALWVYQFSVLSAMISITQVPYNACIIAHERLDVYAHLELLHVFLKLLVVYILLINPFDKLILYSFLMFMVSLLMAIFYTSYSLRHFSESHLQIVYKKNLVMPMLSFSGWNLLSECGYSFRVYGSNIVLNMFFGTIVNAAGGIATTVQGILLGFVASVATAVRPQIIKSYSQGNMTRMNTLLTSSIRINLFFASLITIPLIVDAPYVLQLWLTDVPAYCIQFCRLLLFAIFITTISQIVTIGIHASGDVKMTSLVRSFFYILTPFAIYAYMKWYVADPVWGYIIIVISQMIVCITDIFILHRNINYIKGLPILFDYLKSIVGFILVFFIVIYSKMLCFHPLICLILNCIIEWLMIATYYWIFIFSKKEKNLIRGNSKKLFYRFFR